MKKQKASKPASPNPQTRGQKSRAGAGSGKLPVSWWVYGCVLALVAFSVVLYLNGSLDAVLGQPSQTTTWTEPSSPGLSGAETNLVDPAGNGEVMDDPVELVEIGNSFLGQQEHARAIPYFQKAIESDYEDEELHFNLAYAYGKIGMTNQAIHHYTKSLAISPGYAEAHSNLGDIKLALRQFEEAMTHYRASLEANSKNPSARNNLGKCLAVQGLMEAAIKQFDMAISLDSSYLEARYNLGMAYISERKLDEAIAAFEELLRINPQFRPAQVGLSRAQTLQSVQLNKNTSEFGP